MHVKEVLEQEKMMNSSSSSLKMCSSKSKVVEWKTLMEKEKEREREREEREREKEERHTHTYY